VNCTIVPRWGADISIVPALAQKRPYCYNTIASDSYGRNLVVKPDAIVRQPVWPPDYA
jgi:hypothetical protein